MRRTADKVNEEETTAAETTDATEETPPREVVKQGTIPVVPQPGTSVQTIVTHKYTQDAAEQETKKTEERASAATTAVPYYQDRIQNLAEFVHYWRTECENTGEQLTMLVVRRADSISRPGQPPAFRRPVSGEETLGVFPFIPNVAELIKDLQIANGNSGGLLRVLLMNSESEPLTEYTDAGLWQGVIANPIVAETNGNGNATARAERPKDLLEELEESENRRKRIRAALGLTDEKQVEDTSEEAQMLRLFKNTDVIANSIGTITGAVTSATQAAIQAANANGQPESIGQKIANKILNDEGAQEKLFTLAESVLGRVLGMFGGNRQSAEATQTQSNPQPQQNAVATQSEQPANQEQGLQVVDYLIQACKENQPVNLQTDEFLLKYKAQYETEYQELVSNIAVCDSVALLKMTLINNMPDDRKTEVRDVMKLPHANAFIQRLIDSAKKGN